MVRPTSRLLLAAVALLLAAIPAAAQNYDALSRSDSISLSAGNAKAANMVIQTPTPWPWYVNRTTILSSGARGADLINAYESKFADKPKDTSFPSITITPPSQ